MTDTVLQIISAGAAQGLVGAVAGAEVTGSFGAVGAQLEKFRQGEACDVLILTRAQLDALDTAGELLPGSIRDIGRVLTGVAVRSGSAAPDVSQAEGLRAAFAAADSLYLPDLERSTAGIHIAGVLKKLGLSEQVAARLRTHPNGATAMRELAASSDANPIGCTQVTEILYTPGVQLVGVLSGEFELATLYSAAVPRRSSQPQAAAALLERLTGEPGRAARASGGFV
jgi:molybdate transport system substrate-binding protein